MSGPTLALAAIPLMLLAMALLLWLPATSPAVPIAPPGFFGVDASSDAPADYDGMATADVGVTRNVFPFEILKQRRHKPYYWGYSDGIVGSTARNGIDLIPNIYGAPPWKSKGLNTTPLHGESKQAWRDLLVAAVRRYGPSGTYWAENPDVPYHPVETWQIWNEPNSITWWGPRPDPREYGTLLRRSAQAIHSVDPSAQILTAGIVALPTNPHAIPGTRFLKRLFAAPGVTDAADAVAYHPYASSVSRVQRQLAAARGILRRKGAASTPIWITEIGWGTAGPRDHPLIKTVAGQNRALRDTFEMVLRNRVKLGLGRLLWYQWRDQTDDLCRWCETSGLVHRNSAPKPLLDTFARIATR